MKYFIWTLGCQMNKSDSERIAAVLEKEGYKKTSQEKEADLIAVNACSVRQTAIDRIWGKTKIWKKWKKEKPLTTVLTGCVLNADKEKFEEKFDLVAATAEIGKLPSLLSLRGARRATRQSPRLLRSLALPRNDKKDWSAMTDYFHITPKYSEKFRAYLPVMTGCNHFCSYCAVPYARGRETSRTVKEILREANNLVKNGALEITLLGQNVNNYKPSDPQNFSEQNPYSHNLQHSSPYGGSSAGGHHSYHKNYFAALLWEINQINGLKRLHFTAPHPQNMSDEIIDALILPKQINFLHLPVQSGDDEILKKMNRHYTVKNYLKLVKKTRAKRPDIALGTDIIVGFPGETKKQFENTVKLYKKVRFDIAYIAQYSSRAGTLADKKYKAGVPHEEKKKRWQILQKLMEKITLEKNQEYIGKTVSVLVDKSYNGGLEGNSLEMKRVVFDGPKNLVGKIVDVKIKKAKTWQIKGQMANSK